MSVRSHNGNMAATKKMLKDDASTLRLVLFLVCSCVCVYLATIYSCIRIRYGRVIKLPGRARPRPVGRDRLKAVVGTHSKKIYVILALVR